MSKPCTRLTDIKGVRHVYVLSTKGVRHVNLLSVKGVRHAHVY